LVEYQSLTNLTELHVAVLSTAARLLARAQQHGWLSEVKRPHEGSRRVARGVKSNGLIFFCARENGYSRLSHKQTSVSSTLTSDTNFLSGHGI
jgi:hypothetical protein